MKRRQHPDEERYLLQIRNLVHQHTLMLEQQWSVWGPHYSPSHLPADIAYYTNHLHQLDTQLIAIRRRKRWEGWRRRFMPGHLRRRFALAFVLLIFILLLFILIRSYVQAGRWSVAPTVTMAGVIPQPITGEMRLVGTTTAVPNRAVDPMPITGEVQLVATASLTPAPDATIDPTTIPEFTVPVGERRIIGNTGMIGVRFRLEPYDDAPWFIAIPDQTVVILHERLIDANGTVWCRVTLENGEEGYIKEQYLAPVP